MIDTPAQNSAWRWEMKGDGSGKTAAILLPAGNEYGSMGTPSQDAYGSDGQRWWLVSQGKSHVVLDTASPTGCWIHGSIDAISCIPCQDANVSAV